MNDYTISSNQFFETQAGALLQKGENGSLTPQDVKELDRLVDTVKSQISTTQPTASKDQPAVSTSLEGVGLDLINKVEVIKQKNFSIQREKFTAAVEKGIVSFKEMQGNVLSFQEKMDILLKKGPKNSQGEIEIRFKDVPNKKGAAVGELRAVIKPASLFDDSSMLQSQIKDPLYREDLMRNKDKAHYTFEFFDIGRQAEINQKLQALANERQALETFGNVLEDFALDQDVNAFNSSFTAEQRALFNINPEKKLNSREISGLYEEYQDKLMMFPYTEDSIKTEFAKATISGRFAEDGVIGELKSVNIHSPNLGGKELMDFWDKFCSYMEPSQVYLEDDAKIEGVTGSYNLRLFRLMALPNKASWYTDSWQYQSYRKEPDEKLSTLQDSKEQSHAILPFKEMPLTEALELLQKAGEKPNSQTISVLKSYIGKEGINGGTTLGSLVGLLGDKVRKGEPLYKDLNILFSILDVFSKYGGQDQELLALKEKAILLVNSRFYRKSYS